MKKFENLKNQKVEKIVNDYKSGKHGFYSERFTELDNLLMPVNCQNIEEQYNDESQLPYHQTQANHQQKGLNKVLVRTKEYNNHFGELNQEDYHSSPKYGEKRDYGFDSIDDEGFLSGGSGG